MGEPTPSQYMHKVVTTIYELSANLLVERGLTRAGANIQNCRQERPASLTVTFCEGTRGPTPGWPYQTRGVAKRPAAPRRLVQSPVVRTRTGLGRSRVVRNV